MKVFHSRRSKAVALGLSGLTLVTIAVLAACGGEGFDPASKVDSVRLFVVKADKPYAKPGDTVTLEALYTDARKSKPRPAKLYWIPVLCLNPKDDLYYMCFVPPTDGGTQGGDTRIIPIGPLAERGADAGVPGAGASGGPFANLPTGVDLGPFLPQGPTFSFQIPQDAVIPRKGSEPYGLAIIFNILCAGRIEFVPRDMEGSPQQVPVVCMDENGAKLPPSDYVLGISRVYAWADRINTNPVIEKVTLEGADVDLTKGLEVQPCSADVEKEADCKENKIDVRVSESSWETNPSEVTRDGELREQIWVDYYSDIGRLDSEARLLFDTRKGRVTDTEVTFRAPKAAADGTLWAVVHDNRGGAAWVVIPLHVR